MITELGHFPVGAAQTPDGRFLWTVGAGQTGRGVRISRLSDGVTVQTFDDPNRTGGVVISADGLITFARPAKEHENQFMGRVDYRNIGARKADVGRGAIAGREDA